MPAFDNRIIRILYVHITSVFELTIHACCKGGAVTPPHNTHSKRVSFLWYASMSNFSQEPDRIELFHSQNLQPILDLNNYLTKFATLQQRLYHYAIAVVLLVITKLNNSIL